MANFLFRWWMIFVPTLLTRYCLYMRTSCICSIYRRANPSAFTRSLNRVFTSKIFNLSCAWWRVATVSCFIRLLYWSLPQLLFTMTCICWERDCREWRRWKWSSKNCLNLGLVVARSLATRLRGILFKFISSIRESLTKLILFFTSF